MNYESLVRQSNKGYRLSLKYAKKPVKMFFISLGQKQAADGSPDDVVAIDILSRLHEPFGCDRPSRLTR